jgi:SAM-dependent methyltransferase
MILKKNTFWEKASRFRFFKKKLSTVNLDRLCFENSSKKRTLVVHSEDINYQPYFPNAFTVTKRKKYKADMYVDKYYDDLKKIKNNSFEIILCTGLLEHVPDPKKLINNLYRILKPKGKLIISASSVFSVHEGPDYFFSFSKYSFIELFKEWTKIEELRGSSQPFETLGILMQRILIQCDISPPVRPFIEFLAMIMRFFDRFIYVQYRRVGSTAFEDKIDSMLPSNIQAIVIK